MEPNITRTCRMGLNPRHLKVNSQMAWIKMPAIDCMRIGKVYIYIYVYVYMMATRPMYIDHEACSHALSRTFEPWGLGQVLRETKVTGKQWRLKLMHICKSSKLMHK